MYLADCPKTLGRRWDAVARHQLKVSDEGHRNKEMEELCWELSGINGGTLMNVWYDGSDAGVLS